FKYAVTKRMRADNPVRGVVRFADGQRERRLSDDEYKALGTALAKAKTAFIWPNAIAAIHFLAVTGWRKDEALKLRWPAIDLERRTAILREATDTDTKTGRSLRPLSEAACEILRTIPVRGDGLVFPSSRGGRIAGFPKLWTKVAKLGGLPT